MKYKQQINYNRYLQAAVLHIQQGDFYQAEKKLLVVFDVFYPDYDVPSLLIKLYIKQGRPQDAKKQIQKLIRNHPEQQNYLLGLATILLQSNYVNEAISCFRGIVRNNNNNADSLYNLAFSYRKIGLLEQSIIAYKKALTKNIAHPEEVLTNIGNNYKDLKNFQLAEKHFIDALAMKPNYQLAQLNLAKLLEQLNKKDQAINLYKKMIDFNSLDSKALVALVNIVDINNSNNELLSKLIKCSNSKLLDSELEAVQYALGKAYNDCAEYKRAFIHYSYANRLNGSRVTPFSKEKLSMKINKIINSSKQKTIIFNDEVTFITPIFICGMYRSGSSLVEQVLGSHEKVVTGGETGYLSILMEKYLPKYPIEGLNGKVIKHIRQDYLAMIKENTDKGLVTTDKTPINYQNLAIIKSIFPNSKIIITERNVLDTCLSIFFQRFSKEVDYATDLTDIYDYFRVYEKLTKHWKKIYGTSILSVNYDHFVLNQKKDTKALLSYCNLEWDKRCMAFQNQSNSINTASLWQVRKKLYTSSSNRWKNYHEFISKLIPQSILENGNI